MTNLLPYLASLDFDAMIDSALREYKNGQLREVKETTTEAAVERPVYAIGDTVCLDNTAFQITNLIDREVEMLDPTLIYPIFRVENRENFERLLLQRAVRELHSCG